MKTDKQTRLSEKLNAELDTIWQDCAASIPAPFCYRTRAG